MRYRPFTAAGLSASAIALDLPPGSSDAAARKLVRMALECGVNTFAFVACDPAAAAAVGEAVATTGRDLLLLIARLDLSAGDLPSQTRAALHACDVAGLDAVLVEVADRAVLTAQARDELSEVRATGVARRVALAVEDEEVGAACMDAFSFDILALRFNIGSGWPERNLLRKAAERSMTVIGFGHHLHAGGPVVEAPTRGLSRLLGRRPVAQVGRYAFLDQTPGWAAEDLTLAYTLTESGLASIMVRPGDPERLQRLAEAVERELPAGAAAQIEMARFSKPCGSRVA